MKKLILLIVAVAVLSSVIFLTATSPAHLQKQPLVIAHRGASGYLPEHTLEAKTLAFAMGADYIEQDVVMSKDGHLVVLHDLTLNATTDVANKFPDRQRDDGKFYVIDFTLAELQQLKVHERTTLDANNNQVAVYPNRFPIDKQHFSIHTFAEEIELIQGLNVSMNKQVGIYPEIKAPWFHLKEGKDISLALLKALKDYGYTEKSSPVYLQSFDANELQRVKYQLLPQLNMEIKLVQLIADTSWLETYELKNNELEPYSYDWMFEQTAMTKIAKYADGIGPWKSMLIGQDKNNGMLIISDMVQHAHNAGLEVHPYTFRADPERIAGFATSYQDMVQIYVVTLAIDGLFTDFPDKTISALQALSEK